MFDNETMKQPTLYYVTTYVNSMTIESIVIALTS